MRDILQDVILVNGEMAEENVSFLKFRSSRAASCGDIKHSEFDQLWQSQLTKKQPEKANSPNTSSYKSVTHNVCCGGKIISLRDVSTASASDVSVAPFKKDPLALKAELKGVLTDLDARALSVRNQISMLELKINSPEYGIANKIIGEWRRTRPPEAVRQLAEQEKSNANDLHLKNDLLIALPLLNVTFHINDVGIMGGFLLFVLLLWMRTSLVDEIDDLKIIRRLLDKVKEAMNPKEKKLEKELTRFIDHVYNMISMQQFFIQLPRVGKRHIGKKQKHRREQLTALFSRYSFGMLVALPLSCELALFIADWASDPFLADENLMGYRVTLVVSGAFLALNMVLTACTLVALIDFRRVIRQISLLAGVYEDPSLA